MPLSSCHLFAGDDGFVSDADAYYLDRPRSRSPFLVPATTDWQRSEPSFETDEPVRANHARLWIGVPLPERIWPLGDRGVE